MSLGPKSNGMLQPALLDEPEVFSPICEPCSGPSLPQRTAKLGRGIYSRIDSWVTVALILAALVPLLVRPNLPTLIPRINFLDDSWRLDLVFNALQHVWVGRDVVFTYGALYQAIASLVPWLQGFSLGSVYRSNLPIQFCLAVLLLYAMSAFLLRWQPPWKRAFYILLMAIFWWPGNSKSVISVCAFAVITTLIQGLCDLVAGVVWRAGVASSIVVLTFLFSADCGEYSLAALVIAIIVAALCSARDPLKLKALFKLGLLTSTFISLAALAINFFMLGSIFNFGFWHAAREIADSYRWALPRAMTTRVQLWFVATSLLCILIFLVAWLCRDPRSRHLTHRPLFLQAAFIFSLLSLQTAVIRSDWEHVALGLFPIMALTAAVLVGAANESRSWARSYVPVYLALLLTAIFTGPLPFLTPSTLLRAQNWKAAPNYSSCPDGTYFLDRACFRQLDFLKLDSVSSSVKSRVASSDSVAVFPYENIYGVAARRRIAGGLLQNYFVLGDYLTKLQLSGLARDKSSLLIYSMDGLAAERVDDVSNFTRTPKVWFYFQQHYVEESEPEPGILLLRRDDSRAAHWRSKATDFIGTRQLDNVQEGLPIGLGPLPPWPDHGQFLKLDVTIHYPFWWHVLKPCSLTVDVQFADGTHKLAVALAEPNKETEVWVYPGDELQLRSYFSDNPGDWRAAATPTPVSRIALWLDPIDWLSVAPTSITIHDVQVVRLALR
jgi:hypothetical protein